MNYFRQILRYARPYKMYALGHIVSNILYALFGALSFMALIPMLDILFKTDEAKVIVKPVYQGIGSVKDFYKEYLAYLVQQYAHDDASKALILVIGLVILLFLLKNIFGYLANYAITFLRNGVLRDIRNELYDKIVELPLAYFSEKRKGDILSRATADLNELQYSYLAVFEIIFREPTSILFTIAMMLIISTKLTIFVFIFIPVSGIIISRIGKSLKRKSDRVQKEQANSLSSMEETLSGLRIIKGFNAEEKFARKFKETTDRLYHFSNKLLNRQNLAPPASEFLGILVIAILLWYGGRMVLVDGSLDGSSFIAYMGLAYNILIPAKAISRASYNIKRGGAAAERIQEVLDTENPLKDKPDAKIMPDFSSEIFFDDISFKYEKELVLKNFSLKVPKGKTVALVGQSGSGKSTLANLLSRFYNINEGAILIDGTDIRDLSTKSLRNQMGIVTQDAILFNESVKNNVMLGVDKASDEEVIQALKIANAWEFVKDLPQGIDTNIGDSGNKLSGGQKQRLSIARAVLKNPPIMILDEATSALDTESEQLVQKALEQLMKNRTSVVIAHRLSTIQKADDIVVMKQGKIIEQGKHEALIAKKGEYFKLVNMQSFD